MCATLNVIVWMLFHLKLLMLMNGIILTNSGCNTLRPLVIYCSLGCSQIVYVTLLTINGVVHLFRFVLF